MFKKITILALLFPLICALQLNMPFDPLTTQGQFTITWSTASGDPATFDLRLNNEIFHQTYAIKATIQTADGTLTLTMPVVPPGDGYSFQATSIGNVNNILSQLGPFNIGAAVSSSSTSGSTTNSGSSLTNGGSTSSIGHTVTSTSSGTPSASSGSASFNGASTVVPCGFTAVLALLVAGVSLTGV